MPLDGERYETLDGFRALAIVLLVVGHYSLSWPPMPHFGTVGLQLDLAIVAFFVLTGFLMTSRLLREWDRTGDLVISRYWLRKLVRFYPLLVVFVLFTSVHQSLRAVEVPVLRVLAVLGFAGNYYYALADGDAGRHIISHLWPLAVGVQFVVIWTLVLRVALRAGRLHWLTGGTIFGITAVMAIRTWLVWYTEVPPLYVYNATECRVDALMVGSLLALMLRGPRSSKWFDDLAARPAFTPTVLATLLISVSGSLFYRRGPGYTVEALAVALLIVAALRAERAARWRWLRSSAFLHLSAVSFSLMLWHWYPLGVDARASAFPFALRAPIVLLITGGVGVAAYLVLERPLLILSRRMAERDREIVSR